MFKNLHTELKKTNELLTNTGKLRFQRQKRTELVIAKTRTITNYSHPVSHPCSIWLSSI
jgi:hypothetical protein